MAKKYFHRLLAGLIVVVIIVAAIKIYQLVDKKEGKGTEVVEYDYKSTEVEVVKEHTNFYMIPSSLWPKITIGGSVTAVIVFVALIFGIASYFIGYNAGGKINKPTIYSSIIIGVVVGVLGRSFTVLLQVKLYEVLNYILPINDIIAATIADVIIYTLWLMFICGICVYMYETFTVTAEEAHPTR